MELRRAIGAEFQTPGEKKITFAPYAPQPRTTSKLTLSLRSGPTPPPRPGLLAGGLRAPLVRESMAGYASTLCTGDAVLARVESSVSGRVDQVTVRSGDLEWSISGDDFPAGCAAALQRAEQAVTALLPNDEKLRATCASILERAKIDVGKPAAQRQEPPKVPDRWKNVTQLENSTRVPPHKNLPSRKELYESLDDLYMLVWPDAPTVMRMQKARAASRSTIVMDAAASMGSDFVHMPVDTGELDPCAICALVARSAFRALSRVCASCSCDTALPITDPSRSTAYSQSTSRVLPRPIPYPSSLILVTRSCESGTRRLPRPLTDVRCMLVSSYTDPPTTDPASSHSTSHAHTGVEIEPMLVDRGVLTASSRRALAIAFRFLTDVRSVICPVYGATSDAPCHACH